MAFVANPIVVSSYRASAIPAWTASCSTEILLRFPCDVEDSGLGAHPCACGSQVPAGQILPKLQDQIQSVNSAASSCSLECIVSPAFASTRPSSIHAHLHLTPEQSNLTP